MKNNLKLKVVLKVLVHIIVFITVILPAYFLLGAEKSNITSILFIVWFFYCMGVVIGFSKYYSNKK